MCFKSVKGKYEIVAPSIINCLLIVPHQLTKTCLDSTKQSLKLQ